MIGQLTLDGCPAPKPRLLDLFCGAGGATKGYQRADFYVIGVDINPQPNYCGDEFFQMDALRFMRLLIHSWENGGPWGYDAIHASPPCQRWSTKTGGPDEHPDLITPLRPMLQLAANEGVPYVIENVPGAPLNHPVELCGSTFGLGVRRHRMFECSFSLLVPGCFHGTQKKQYELYDHGKWYLSQIVHVFGNGGGKGKQHWNDAMGIDWMTQAELVEAIPPAFTEYVGTQLMSYITPAGHAIIRA